jgi:hypothetical protein
MSRYDFNQYGRPRLALFNRVMREVLIVEIAVASIIALAMLAVTLDWTWIIAPSAMLPGVIVQRKMFDRIYRARPDYAKIRRMEREIYGRTFHHDGGPDEPIPPHFTEIITRAAESGITIHWDQAKWNRL